MSQDEHWLYVHSIVVVVNHFHSNPVTIELFMLITNVYLELLKHIENKKSSNLS